MKIENIEKEEDMDNNSIMSEQYDIDEDLDMDSKTAAIIAEPIVAERTKYSYEESIAPEKFYRPEKLEGSVISEATERSYKPGKVYGPETFYKPDNLAIEDKSADSLDELTNELQKLNLKYIRAVNKCLRYGHPEVGNVVRTQMASMKYAVDTVVELSVSEEMQGVRALMNMISFDEPLDVFREWAEYKRVPLEHAQKYLNLIKNRKNMSKASLKGQLTKLYIRRKELFGEY